MRIVSSAALIAALAGCGRSTTAPTPKDPSGNYAGLFDGDQATLEIHLNAAGGTLSGSGWSTILPSLLAGGAITGTYSEQEVHFDLVPPSSPLSWHFDGSVESDTLRGDFALVPGPGFLVELARADTVASGLASVALSGGLNLSVAGTAIFGYYQPGFRATLAVSTSGPPGFQTIVTWGESTLPAPGSYTLSPAGGSTPTAAFVRSEAGTAPETLPLTQGTLVIEASNRYALIGFLDLVVTDPKTSLPTHVHVDFSAGCGAGC